MKVAAFDIDGVLTTDEGMALYQNMEGNPDTEVHIVTARNRALARDFVFQNQLEPDSLQHTQLKGRALRSIDGTGTYYGSWFRDRIHARAAGWEYEQL